MKEKKLLQKYTKSNYDQAEAEQIYQELLESDLDPADRQVLYNRYVKYLHFIRKESHKSTEYHMMAAVIPQLFPHHENSIRTLKKIRERNRNQMYAEIEEFLANLED